ncbi:MAG: carboxy-S-adenosyl-L-methionine synthase CmoA [Gammaproteobacteria bacterium]|nr:carboxy-S-adenosyl-L-methionine synthase CmoA [Gammaproteobacteria bacterium]
MDKDEVFARPLSDINAFEFNASVTRVFRDMISRSVPGYELLLRLIGLYANVFVRDNSRVYDLGCSLGEVSLLINEQADAKDISIVAVDNSPSMIKKCQSSNPSVNAIDWVCDDIQRIPVENASMVVLNLTLQFIAPDERQTLLENIFEGLNAGGILVLSEKIELDEPMANTRMIQLHQAFKKMQGYSELEISQKRTALENVMVPDLESGLYLRLQQTGFREIYQCFRCFNFVSYLAIKA